MAIFLSCWPSDGKLKFSTDIIQTNRANVNYQDGKALAFSFKKLDKIPNTTGPCSGIDHRRDASKEKEPKSIGILAKHCKFGSTGQNEQNGE